ncbi:response regulator [Hufsiella ginkgonis]|uniref:Response regulator n=1 Tax=Hufsiella ginkgonis TaxID=2695274 RepID=A0A7K1Y065_9SPHI|nr:response regulator [Hufsiella ginkgonis]MXV16661.1 response regulator [Hufsiella ginkgonis]
MRGKVVYVLEDDADISDLIAYILCEAGYNVEQCGTVRKFNEVVTRSLPDIFILDVLLPDGNGLEICKQLRTDPVTRNIPVLMMSANKTRRDIESFGCAVDFISKPFNIDHFRQRVDQYV